VRRWSASLATAGPRWNGRRLAAPAGKSRREKLRGLRPGQAVRLPPHERRSRGRHRNLRAGVRASRDRGSRLCSCCGRESGAGIGHQTGRGSSLGRGLRLHRKVEIGRLVGVDLRDFRFRLVRCLAGGCDGGAQRIKKARIAGQGFEFLHSGASLLDHGVFEIEMDLFAVSAISDCSRVNGFLMNRAIMSRAIDGKGKRIFPLGGEVRRGFGGQFAGVCGACAAASWTANSGGAPGLWSGAAEADCGRSPADVAPAAAAIVNEGVVADDTAGKDPEGDGAVSPLFS